MSDSAPPPPPPSEEPDRLHASAARRSGAPIGQNPVGPPPGSYPPTAVRQTARPRAACRNITTDRVKDVVQNAHKFDLGMIGAGVLLFFFSFFPYYTARVEVKGGGDLADLIGESAIRATPSPRGTASSAGSRC